MISRMVRIRKVMIAMLLVASIPVWGLERVVFTPQWTAQAQFAGYYVAQEKGFYREVGLEVEIVHPSLYKSAVASLRNNECQITTLQLCQAMQLVDEGLPVVNILQTSMNNAMVIVSARGKDPLTQKGERVGTWCARFGQLAECMSIKEGLNYQWIRFAQDINLFIAGAIDATLAMSYNEYYQLLQAGVELDESTVYRFCDHGYNVQEDGAYMPRAYYEQHKQEAQLFARASRRGWEWAAEHPDETIEIVSKYVRAERVATNRELQRLMLKEILRLQIDRESGLREFRLRPDMVEQASKLMTECQMLKREVTYDELIDR